MSEQPIRAAVAGCGSLGTTLAKITASTAGVRLVALCDPHGESARKLADQLDGVAACQTHEEMLDQHDLDAVVIVTPTHTHAQIAIDAARAGLHVYCEKPMAITLAECDAMIEAASANDVKLMIGFVRRFMPNYREMKRRVDAGDLGQLRLIHSLRMSGPPPLGVGNWRTSAAKVGGLHSGYVHELDQMLWIGGDVTAVSALKTYGAIEAMDVEDSIWMCLRFASGAIGALGASQIYPVGCYELGVAGVKGSMKIVSGTTELFHAPAGGSPEKLQLPAGDFFREELEHFFDCVRTGSQPSVTGLDGRRCQAVIEAAHRAADSGQVVEIEP